MVDLPEASVGIVGHHFFKNSVVLGNAPIEIFLLNEVDSDGSFPVEFAHSGDLFHNLIFWQRFSDAEDEPHSKVRVLLFDVLGCFVEKVSEGRVGHFSQEIPLTVIVFQLHQQRTELYSLISVGNKLPQDVLNVFNEDILTVDQR